MDTEKVSHKNEFNTKRNKTQYVNHKSAENSNVNPFLIVLMPYKIKCNLIKI